MTARNFWAAFIPAALACAGCLGPAKRASVAAPPPPAETRAGFEDDGPREDLKAAVRASLDHFKSLPTDKSYDYQGRRITAARLRGSLEAFLALLDAPPDAFRREMERSFEFVPSPGADGRGAVTFSAYYEHALPASLVRTDGYRYPLYAPPPDLAGVYLTREEIDSGGALRGRGLEIAWAKDPLDIYYLQVEGSGWLMVEGEPEPVRVRYAGNNGRPYKSIGLHLIEEGLVPRENFDRTVLEGYLRDHPEERQGVINRNPRYVFFRIDRGPRRKDTLGSLGVALTPRRSVATDPAVFPPGALCWMEVPGENPVARFVVSQDEGGAIKGPGRVDYFVGAGEEAEDFAARFWRKGRFYLVLKKEEGRP